jgi:hypothetical protein
MLAGQLWGFVAFGLVFVLFLVFVWFGLRWGFLG